VSKEINMQTYRDGDDEDGLLEGNILIPETAWQEDFPGLQTWNLWVAKGWGGAPRTTQAAQVADVIRRVQAGRIEARLARRAARRTKNGGAR
jgi:hypothetical protein